MRVKFIEWVRFRTLASKAFDQGATWTDTTITWDCAPECAKPYMVTLASTRPPKADVRIHKHTPLHEFVKVSEGTQTYLDILTRCRKCANCLEYRSRLWTARGFEETKNASRTWFMTFTVNPQNRFELSCRAQSWDFTPVYKELSKEFTLYLKRVRKAGYKFRYMMVAEKHKDGFPHLHALVHEVSAAIPKRALQERWKLGFTNCKLADKFQARYLAKYLAKEQLARVRASVRYGQYLYNSDTINPEGVKKVERDILTSFPAAARRVLLQQQEERRLLNEIPWD